MRRLLTGYAVWFNRRHLRRGHLFQNRYKSIVCEEDPYLLELVRYIHLNPLRSRKAETIQESDAYRWTGHSVLVGKVRRDWQERNYVLHQFGRKQAQSVRAYRRFIEDGKEMGRRTDLVDGGPVRSLGGWSKVLSTCLKYSFPIEYEHGEKPWRRSRCFHNGKRDMRSSSASIVIG
jgi:putative transposase